MTPLLPIWLGFAFAVAIVALDASPACAGMPSPPSYQDIAWPPGLTSTAVARLQTLSFFLMVFLVSALAVQWMWNALRTDFPRLPRLSYPKALGLVGLWSLLFLLVLTMISGARELMTPGAWKRDGATYALADAPKLPDLPPAPTEDDRRVKLMRLGGALRQYAERNGGAFPANRDPADIPPELWSTPHPSGMSYRYVPGRTVRDGGTIVAYEPELFGDARFALTAAGDVKRFESADLSTTLAAEDDE
jgi:hypothetical protein